MVSEGNGVVKGRVVDSKTFAPIENVKISTSPISSTFFTDKDGYFTFESVLIGKYSFQAQKEGYVSKFEAAEVTVGSTSQLIFEMETSKTNNKPPEIPLLTSPADNSINQSLKLVLSWTASDKEMDPLTYVIRIRNGTTNTISTFSDIKTNSIEVSGLSYSTKYYWQVSSSDAINPPSNSVTNLFVTQDFPNSRFLYVRKVSNNNVIFASDGSGNELQLSSLNTNCYRPRKNLQANKIAYISSDGSQNQLYTMNPDGSSIFKVTNSVPIAGFNMEQVNFCWSSNGSQIIYPNFDKLYRINASGDGLVELYKTPNGKFISECDWSQDGSQIALKVNNTLGYEVEIYVINTSGNLLYTVLSNTFGAVSGLNISVDNKKIIYTRDVSEYESSSYRRINSRIFIYDRAANTSSELNTNKADGFNDLDVKFSPNEAEVIFVSTSNDGLSVKEIIRSGVGQATSRTVLTSGGSMPDWE